MSISNQEIAKILYEIGEYLDMQGVRFKPRAYEKAAATIGSMQEETAEVHKKGGLKALENIPGIGVSIAEKIEELIKTGHSEFYEQLKKKTPVNLSELTGIEGLGPRKIKILYQKLKIKNVGDLERAARAGKIAELEGFGTKSEKNILRGIGFFKQSAGRFVIGSVLPEIREIEERLRRFKGVERAEVAGSVRRRKETIGDADILVISDKPKPVMNFFVSMPEVVRISAHGETKSAVKLKSGLDMDVRVVPRESYGAALAYFTGSKDHNIALRQIAIKKGLTLSEYGLFKGTKNRRGKLVVGRTEGELYKALGLVYVEPEMREMTGEVALAMNNNLPKLIGYGDLEGDLQVQTNWTDGAASIEEMAKAAMKHGLKYIVITDHTHRLAMTGGLDGKRILKQMAEIDKLNSKFKIQNSKFRVLKGTECDILKDGKLDLPDEVLKKLDVVGVSVHSNFNLSIEEQTKRIGRAMKNPNVDILFHPTGRIIQRREPYKIDIGEIIKTAKATGTILEINASPDRLDLKDQHIRMCVDLGVKMAIDSDAHAPQSFSFLEFGIAQARRGWAAKADIINAWPVERMLTMLK